LTTQGIRKTRRCGHWKRTWRRCGPETAARSRPFYAPR
jgi:hypothetical protein